ncbi:MAG: hypothetical protein K2V38_05470 [Gemmataceae bacterium]|nr:hypothetical protein [Gemmataceae bacterium]
MSDDWMGFLSGAYDGRAPGPHDGRPLSDLLAERDALRRFKGYVHGRLDAAGVPADPDSPHKAEGCRIGGRLDLVLARWAAHAELVALVEFAARMFCDPEACDYDPAARDFLARADAVLVRLKGGAA